MEGVEGAETDGVGTVGAAVVKLRRLAALAMRRATEERVVLAVVEADFRVLDLAAGLLAAELAAVRLRPTDVLRPDGAALALAAGFAFAAGLALAGLALLAARLVRAFGAAAGRSTMSVVEAALAADGRRRDRAGAAALALAAGRALRAGVAAGALGERVRWDKTRAHSSSLRLEGLEPWVWATFAAFSISAIRFVQEVAKRLSDWDLAPLSRRVATTPSAVTFLRRRLKISFWSWAIRASALSLIVIVS